MSGRVWAQRQGHFAGPGVAGQRGKLRAVQTALHRACGASWPAMRFEKGGFARAVGAHEGQDLAPLHPQRRPILVSRAFGVAHSQVFWSRSNNGFIPFLPVPVSWRRISSTKMTTGAPNTAVTELMDSSVGANRLRAMKVTEQAERRPAQRSSPAGRTSGLALPSSSLDRGGAPRCPQRRSARQRP